MNIIEHFTKERVEYTAEQLNAAIDEYRAGEKEYDDVYRMLLEHFVRMSRVWVGQFNEDDYYEALYYTVDFTIRRWRTDTQYIFHFFKKIFVWSYIRMKKQREKRYIKDRYGMIEMLFDHRDCGLTVESNINDDKIIINQLIDRLTDREQAVLGYFFGFSKRYARKNSEDVKQLKKFVSYKSKDALRHFKDRIIKKLQVIAEDIDLSICL